MDDRETHRGKFVCSTATGNLLHLMYFRTSDKTLCGREVMRPENHDHRGMCRRCLHLSCSGAPGPQFRSRHGDREPSHEERS